VGGSLSIPNGRARSAMRDSKLGLLLASEPNLALS
jgi:hypothetical protein